MKNKLSLLGALLFTSCLTSCNRNYPTPSSISGSEVLSIKENEESSFQTFLVYRTIEIDGEKYYISKTTHGYWVLGPKVEKGKSEKAN